MKGCHAPIYYQERGELCPGYVSRLRRDGFRHERHRRRSALRRGKMRGNLDFQMERRQRRREVADGFVWDRNSLNFIMKSDPRI